LALVEQGFLLVLEITEITQVLARQSWLWVAAAAVRRTAQGELVVLAVVLEHKTPLLWQELLGKGMLAAVDLLEVLLLVVVVAAQGLLVETEQAALLVGQVAPVARQP
jgi:hypothetical protein